MSFSSADTTKASNRPPVLTNPVRYPQSANAPMRTKRAVLLLIMSLFIPGSVQTVAGNRRLGRIALRVTFTVWALLILALLFFLINRGQFLNLLTNQLISLLLIGALIVLAVGWAFIFIDTLRIIRPVLLAPGLRAVIPAAVVVLMVVTSGGLGYTAWLINSGRNAIGNIFGANGPDMTPVDGRYNFLVMGGDAGADRSGRRPDSIIVLSIDANTGKTVTISIPRNLENAQFSADSPMRKIYPDGYNCGDNCIINFLYTEVTDKYADLYPGKQDPGAQAMMDAAGGTLGLTIQGYVLIDMGGFSQLVDALGGVKINAGGWVPISGAATADGGHLPPEGWIAPGEQTLNGQQALWYARSREWVTDYARSQRQQCIQAAILKQMDPATVLTKFDAIANAGAKVIESDLPQQQLGSFLDLAIKAKSYPLARLTVGPPDFDSSFPVSPDFTVLHQKVKDLIADKTAPATSKATTSSAAKPAQGSTPAKAPAPAAQTQQQSSQSQAPAVTKDYLQQLAVNGNTTELTSLLANNGKCTPG
ncbi:LCP family protein required for cell wall assembly [Psychromicrobium silvestre]|uniref:LCP family protein required for cell wall assembly n=1 Tax=Psychromicrobium silvestre TaxID=1645614 RepID=A0A7Y9LVV0_9MICC|nr:LCP family protein [Psychromicrobium silvestre]NYE96542.1 LCP family protein required for cell wall assembly [Psychromicrobium silvestre]